MGSPRTRLRDGVAPSCSLMDSRASRTSWILRDARHGMSNAAFTLLCYPPAGVGAATFCSTFRTLPPQVQVIGLQPPGRENRFRETAITDFDALVQQFAIAVDEIARSDLPWGLFGHSLGALVSFELIRHLRRLDGRLPAVLWTSGRRAPHLPSTAPPGNFADALAEAHLSDSCFVDLPPEVQRAMLPALRADMAVARSYRYREDVPLACPIVSLTGSDDKLVDVDAAASWSAHTSSWSQVRVYPGGHFYYQEAAVQLCDAIADDIRKLCLAVPSGHPVSSVAAP